MSWFSNLLPASFRGVPFQVSSTSSEYGRRNQTHEYPFRDVPYTEDLGRSARKNKIEAFVIGDDHIEQANLLITAIEKEGSGALIHPIYGELNVNIVGNVSVNNSVESGRMSILTFNFIEAGELIFPDSSTATDDVVNENADNVDQELLDAFEGFDLTDVPDFVQGNIIDNTMSILDGIADTFNTVTPYVKDAVKVLNGDLSSILGVGGNSFINSVKTVWISATKFTNTVNGLISRVKVFNGISFIKNVLPSGVWTTDSRSTKTQKTQQNYINEAIRVTALTESSRVIASLPKQTENKKKDAFPPVSIGSIQTVVEQDVSSSTDTNSTNQNNTISFDDLIEIKTSINESFDKELSRLKSDNLYMALVKLKAAVNQDINDRLIKIEKTIIYVPNEVLPDLVLAHYLYNNAKRYGDISSRNKVLHPGFVPISELRVPKQ